MFDNHLEAEITACHDCVSNHDIPKISVEDLGKKLRNATVQREIQIYRERNKRQNTKLILINNVSAASVCGWEAHTVTMQYIWMSYVCHDCERRAIN